MGIGFICTITGVILATAGWQYAFWFPYSHPMLAIKTLEDSNHHNQGAATAIQQINVDIFTKEIFVSLAVAVVVFIAGYFIIQKKSVK